MEEKEENPILPPGEPNLNTMEIQWWIAIDIAVVKECSAEK